MAPVVGEMRGPGDPKGIWIWLAAMIVVLIRPGSTNAMESTPLFHPDQRQVGAVRLELPASLERKRESLERLVEIRPGGPYDPSLARDTISALYLTGLFSDVLLEVTSPESPGPLNILIRPTPRLYIASVRFSGHDRISRRDLARTVRLWPGAPMDSMEVQKEADRLTSFCRERGFYEAAVEWEEHPSSRPEEIDILFAISEGPWTRLGEVAFSGRPGYPDGELRERVPIKTGKSVSKKDLEASLEGLRDFYLEEGFWEASVSDPEVDLDTEAHTARITFAVERGPRFEARFEGNHRFSRRKLLRVLDIEETGLPLGFFDNAPKTIENFYKDRGHYFARAACKVERHEAEDECRLTFTIDEGPRLAVERIEFRGENPLDEKELRGQMLTRERYAWGLLGRGVLRDEILQEDLEAIRSLFHRSGYHEAEVGEPRIRFGREKKRAFIEIEVRPGPITRIDGIEVCGNESIPDEALLKQMETRAGLPLDPLQLKEDCRSIADAYGGLGRIETKVKSHILSGGKGEPVTVRIEIAEGEAVKVDDVVLSGNRRTRDEFIMRELTVDRGEPVDPEAILRSRRRLQGLGYFRRVEVRVVEDPEDSGARDFLVKVEEKKTAGISFGAGYSTEDGVRGFLELYQRNVVGRGLDGSLRIEVNKDEQKFSARFREPYLLGRRLEATASSFYQSREELSYHLGKLAGAFSIVRSFSPRLKGTLRYELEIYNLYNVKPDVRLTPLDQGESSIGTLSAIAVWDGRDDPILPSRGLFASLDADISHGALGTDATFARVTATLSGYIPAPGGSVVALRARAGYAGSFRRVNEIPIHKRFFLGGGTSMRGFSRNRVGPVGVEGNTVGGTILLNVNAEIRVPIAFGLWIAGFFDAGNTFLEGRPPKQNLTLAYEYSLEGRDGGYLIEGYEISASSIRTSAGAGLRYITPIGPLSLDLGLNLDPNPEEDQWHVHFNVGYPF